MKSSDPLLMAWSETFSQKADASAIFATDSKILRTFREVEERAREFQATIDMFPEHSVVALQIGNHEDWPSILIAALRKRLVVLPLEQSIRDQQRDAALEICQAAGIVETTVRKIDKNGARRSVATQDHWNAAGNKRREQVTKAVRMRNWNYAEIEIGIANSHCSTDLIAIGQELFATKPDGARCSCCAGS